MLSESAHDRYKCYLSVLGGRSIVSVAGGSCEEAKNVEVLGPGKSVVHHHAEGIRRSLSLQTSTSSDLSVQQESWTVICRD